MPRSETDAVSPTRRRRHDQGWRRGRAARSAAPGVSCLALPVDVEGHQAVWIFTEFETDESLKNLRDWMIPENWPNWGGEMFKEMRPIGSVDLRPDRWWCEADAVQTTSRSSRSAVTASRPEDCAARSSRPPMVGHELRPRPQHRGAAQRRPRLPHGRRRGRRRHVKALKVVGFTNTLLNTAATSVCPEWSTWVQRATQVGAAQAAGGSVDPTPGSVGVSDPEAFVRPTAPTRRRSPAASQSSGSAP